LHVLDSVGCSERIASDASHTERNGLYRFWLGERADY